MTEQLAPCCGGRYSAGSPTLHADGGVITVDRYEALDLQDHLTINERRDIDQFWSLLASLIKQDREGRSTKYRASNERDLARHAAHLLLA